MENDNFRSDYERLKHKFESAEHYNDYLRKKLKKTEKELSEYQLMLSYTLKRN